MSHVRFDLHRGISAIGGTLLVLTLVGGSVGAGESPPDWSEGLALFLSGGTPGGTVEVQLNGEVVARLPDENGGKRFDVAERLRAGLNDIEVRVEATGEPTGLPAELLLARSKALNERQNVITDPLVRIELPATPPAEPCVETIRFWAGPPETPPAKLGSRYWVVASGPSIGYRVTTLLNDVPLYSVISGDSYVEITDHVVKGRNGVSFEATPSCLVAATDNSATLRMSVALGWEDRGGIYFADPPLGGADMNATRKPRPFTRGLTFRAK